MLDKNLKNIKRIYQKQTKETSKIYKNEIAFIDTM